MNNQPKISIITPSFNQGPFLEETIRSVLDQNYPALEYIIIDGGSSDDSVNIIKRYADRLAYWTSEKDNGQTDALNKGFRKATGDIVAYLNSDDLYLPGSLARVAREFSANPKCRWLTGSCIFFGSGKEDELIRPIVPERREPWLLDWGHWVVSQPSVFWHRELFETHGFLDESYDFCMDYEFWIRLVFGGEKCFFVDQTLSRFRLHPSSKTVGNAHSFKPEEAAIRSKYRRKLSAEERRELAGIVRNDLLHAATTSAISGSRRLAAQQLLTAAKLHPSSVLSRPFLVAAKSFVRSLARQGRK